MSTKKGGTSRGPPKHQNKNAFKPGRGIAKSAKELLIGSGPLRRICQRCKDVIEWKRKYGKYKALVEPQKCHGCGKRAVQQAYYALCPDCATEKNVCAKCMKPAELLGLGEEREAEERKQLEEALMHMRERDRRSLLRAMNKPGAASGAKAVVVEREVPPADSDGERGIEDNGYERDDSEAESDGSEVPSSREEGDESNEDDVTSGDEGAASKQLDGGERPRESTQDGPILTQETPKDAPASTDNDSGGGGTQKATLAGLADLSVKAV